jgi:hypothetical protein
VRGHCALATLFLFVLLLPPTRGAAGAPCTWQCNDGQHFCSPLPFPGVSAGRVASGAGAGAEKRGEGGRGLGGGQGGGVGGAAKASVGGRGSVKELADLLGAGGRLWAGQRRHLVAQLPPLDTASSDLAPEGKVRRLATPHQRLLHGAKCRCEVRPRVISGLPMGRECATQRLSSCRGARLTWPVPRSS